MKLIHLVAVAGIASIASAGTSPCNFANTEFCEVRIKSKTFFLSSCNPVATSSYSSAAAFCGAGGGGDADVNVNPSGGSSQASAACGACDEGFYADANGDGVCNSTDIELILQSLGQNRTGAAVAVARTNEPLNGFLTEVTRTEAMAVYGGVSTAEAEIVIEVDPGCMNQWSVTTSGSIDPDSGFESSSGDGFGIFRVGVVAGGQLYAVLFSDCGAIGVNSEFNKKTGLWEYSGEATGSGSVVCSEASFYFADEVLDVNTDGRFNSLDVDALALLIGATDQATLDLYDFDQDNIIGQPDVDYIDLFVDAGIDSGIFGDSDDDGAIDCSDLQALRLLDGLTLCDAGYVIALDYDLDGDIDAADEAALEAILLPIAEDLNGDHRVDAADLGVLTTQFGTAGPEADLNSDGIVDAADVGILVAAFGEDCS